MAKPVKRKNKTKSAETDDILFRIRRVIAAQLKKNPDQITLEAGLQTDLQGDSLDALEIIFQLEEEFHMKVDDKEARQFVTVQDVVTYVKKKAQDKG